MISTRLCGTSRPSREMDEARLGALLSCGAPHFDVVEDEAPVVKRSVVARSAITARTVTTAL
jgi:hypothetical protein